MVVAVDSSFFAALGLVLDLVLAPVLYLLHICHVLMHDISFSISCVYLRVYLLDYLTL